MSQGSAEAPGPSSPGPAPSPGTLEERQDALVRGCIDRLTEHCIEALAVRLRQSEARYLSWVDPRTGPTGRERYIEYGLYETHRDPTECVEHLVSVGATLPEDEELTSATERFAEAVTTLVPENNAAASYYERRGYLRDSAREGRQRHPRLIEAFRYFRDADEELRAVLRVRERALDDRRLARLEGDPARRREWLLARLDISAERLAQLVSKVTLGPGRRLIGVDPAPLEEHVEALQEAIDEATRAQFDGLDDCLGEAQELAQVATEVLARLRSGRPFSAFDANMLDSPGAWMVDESPARVAREREEMERAFDTWRRFHP